jgi:hypothetical protein
MVLLKVIAFVIQRCLISEGVAKGTCIVKLYKMFPCRSLLFDILVESQQLYNSVF